jgi:hypothetical protein
LAGLLRMTRAAGLQNRSVEVLLNSLKRLLLFDFRSRMFVSS